MSKLAKVGFQLLHFDKKKQKNLHNNQDQIICDREGCR